MLSTVGNCACGLLRSPAAGTFPDGRKFDSSRDRGQERKGEKKGAEKGGYQLHAASPGLAAALHSSLPP